MAAEKPSSKGQAWFCTTGLPSDIVIEVEDMSFHLHKFPLMSKSRKLHQLITEQEAKNQTDGMLQEQEKKVEEEEEEEPDEIQCQITLQDFPGGSEPFEMAAKFCYGVKIELSSSTVAPLRCAAEFLEMTEEYSEDNLVSKTERFLSQSVLKSLKESVKALKSCEKVMDFAETLNITERCIDSIASRASAADPSLFGWPVSDENKGAMSAQSLSRKKATTATANANATSATASSVIAAVVGRGSINNADSWLDTLSLLTLPSLNRVILAMKAKDLNPEVIESCLIYYAKKHIPGITRLTRKQSSSSSSSSTVTETEQRQVLETIVSNLPLQRSTTTTATTKSSTTRFLFGLLRTANILNASESCRSALEKKIGSQLDQATLDDLLIPSYSYLNETLYDVDCLERILGYFLDGLEEERNSEIEDNRNVPSRPALMLVGKLIDGYLAEIASDANLKPDRFYNLAMSLPEQARLFDDGLYRAVDVYLKAHPWISENEREKICGAMDCQKLTLEACTHAAQNERLPLRAVVQVLFFEQLQLRHAIAGTLIAAESDPARPSVLRPEHEEAEVEEGAITATAPAVGGENGCSNTWRAAVRENQVLRLDMDSMRTRVHQLERECSTMKKVIEKIDKEGGGGTRGWRGSITRKFGCKFKTQVCDSHESTVVNARKGRQHHHQQ